MKTVDYLDMLKSKKGLKSNYAAAKYLGLTQSALSNYQNGKGFFADEVAIRVATDLDLNVGIVLADIHAEREKDPVVQGAWVQIARSLQQATAAAFVFVMLGIPTPSAEASTLNRLDLSALHSIHYANLIKLLKKCSIKAIFSFRSAFLRKFFGVYNPLLFV